jgi:hypothetical protein
MINAYCSNGRRPHAKNQKSEIRNCPQTTNLEFCILQLEIVYLTFPIHFRRSGTVSNSTPPSNSDPRPIFDRIDA